MSNNSNSNQFSTEEYLNKVSQDLPQFPEDTNYYDLIITIIRPFKETNTKEEELISSMILSRRLIKHHPSLGQIMFDNIFLYILFYIDIDEDYDLLLNALLLFYEAFSLQNNISQYLTESLLSIIKVTSYNESISDLVFSSAIANQILKLFFNEFPLNNLFDSLVSYFDYNDPLVCNQAAKTAFDLVMMLDKRNRIKLPDWDRLIKKAADANLSNENNQFYSFFIKNAKGLFTADEWEKLLMTLDNKTLIHLLLFDSFDLKDIIQKKNRMTSDDDEAIDE